MISGQALPMIRPCLFLTLIFSLALSAKAADPESLITHGPRDRQQVALTFDLCQSPGRTTTLDLPLIDILRREKVPATFFIGGDWMRTHSAELRQLAAVPYFELANHSWSHPDLRRRSRAEITFQVSRTNTELTRLTGRSSNYFRLPYGNYNDATLQTLTDLQQHIIQWDVVSGDPDPQISGAAMRRTIISQLRNGSIVVMHANGRGRHTAEVLPEIIAYLRERRLRPVTISALLNPRQEPASSLSLQEQLHDAVAMFLAGSASWTQDGLIPATASQSSQIQTYGVNTFRAPLAHQ